MSISVLIPSIRQLRLTNLELHRFKMSFLRFFDPRGFRRPEFRCSSKLHSFTFRPGFTSSTLSERSKIKLYPAFYWQRFEDELAAKAEPWDTCKHLSLSGSDCTARSDVAILSKTHVFSDFIRGDLATVEERRWGAADTGRIWYNKSSQTGE